MNNGRRFFLKSSGITLASVGFAQLAPTFLQRAAFAESLTSSGAPNGRRKTLIAIFQRGAVDGLNMVVPHGDADYYRMRPTLGIPQPGRGVTPAEAALDLDGYFGLHPSLAGFKQMWNDKRLAIVEAVGSPDSTRSHFDAQDYMESATPGTKSTQDGWLNRLMQASKEGKDPPHVSPFRAVSMTNAMPRVLQGRAPALAIPNLNNFTVQAGLNSASVQGGFEAIYEQTANDKLGGAGKEIFEAINYLKRVNPGQYKAENGAQYPAGRFGQSLLQIAQLIKANVGLEVAFTDIGGWDTHFNQGAAHGQLAWRLAEFGSGIAALVTDLGQRMDDVVVLTMSEFGRTARENGSRGTDHGHANAMFAIGNTVRGGKVYGEWPGLGSSQLYQDRDLALTTDFRDVFGELVQKHLGHKNLKAVFPGHEVSAEKFRGLLS